MPMLKKIFDLRFFLQDILVPLVGLAVYCASFAYFLSYLSLEGVNYFFTARLLRYLWVAIAITVLVCLAILISRRGKQSVLGFLKDKVYVADLLLLLLPLTPIVQYVLSNREFLSLLDALYVLIFCALFFSLYIFIIPFVTNTVIPSGTLMIMGLAFVFTIASMASVSSYYSWFETGALRKQLLVLGGVFVVVWLLYALDQRKLLYLFIIVNLIVNSFVQVFTQADMDSRSATIEENKLLQLVDNRTPATTPNIYLLVYDAYVPNETMMGYGIDNSAQENYLLDQGFILYPHTYSVASSTLSTMSLVLNASDDFYGNKRRGVSGDGTTQRILKNVGYKTYGLFYSDYMFRGFGTSYDVSLPEIVSPPYLQLLKAIGMGEFRFDIEKIGTESQTHDQFVKKKQYIFSALPESQTFLYMHTDLPTHSQNSGACLPDEIDLFEQRLRRANLEMQQDLSLIIANDPGAIVIIAGDHGPYLTKTCDWTSGAYDLSEITRQDIQDRYGTFLAIRWPTGDFTKYDDIQVLQDVFPAVFAYLYQDAKILHSKIKPRITASEAISGAIVNNGIIYGGVNDGEPLFIGK